MLTRTHVINDGLRHIGVTLISDPGEASEQARQANGVYDQVVRSELESYAWFFAKRQAALPQLADAPLFRYSRQYNLPADFIRLVEFEERWVFHSVRYIDVNPVAPYEIQGRAIMTDIAAPLRITYLRDVTEDPGSWTPLFVNCVAAALALRLAMPLTKSDTMVNMAAGIYKNEIARAKKANAIQMPPVNIPDGSWLTARIY